MSAPIKLIIAGFCLLATAYNIRAHENQPLQCWHCSSDTIGAEDFCDVTFQEDNIPTDLIRERNINLLRTCNSSINSAHERPVCRKTVDEYDGKIVTKRFCYYTNTPLKDFKEKPVQLCNVSTPEKNVRQIFCGDCIDDRCNGATPLAAILAAILLPALAVANQLAN